MYLDKLMARLQLWHASALKDCAAAGAAMAAAVLGGGRLYPWSGRGEFWAEASGTAGGLMGVYDLEASKIQAADGLSLSSIGEGDLVIIA
eukprot:SAG11_NODE_12152_length_719_cov_1.409677_2_plen_90_part_00